MPLRASKKIILCALQERLRIPSDAHCICLKAQAERFLIYTLNRADWSLPLLDYALCVKDLAKRPKWASFERFRFCIVDSTERRAE